MTTDRQAAGPSTARGAAPARAPVLDASQGAVAPTPTSAPGAASPGTAGRGAVDPDVVKTLGVGKSGLVGRIVRRVLLVTVIGGAVVGAYLGYRHLTREIPVDYVESRIRRGDLSITVTATGTLQPRRTVQVGAEVSGRILAVHADYNQRVTAGQLLVEIDPQQSRARVREARANMSAARAAVRQARANLDEARVNLRRTETLVRSEVATEQQLDTARAAVHRFEAALASADAQVALANAALTAAQTDLSRTVVHAPIDGIVLSRSVEPGQAIASAFQTPVLFTIAEDLARMELRVDVDEADIGLVREGQTATFSVDAYPGRRFEARLVAVRNAPRTVQNVVTYEAVLAVENADLALRPGMTATATIVAERRRNVLLAPSAALRFTPPDPAGRGGMDEARQKRRDADRRSGHRLYVRSGTGLRAIRVETGPSDGRNTEIRLPSTRPSPPGEEGSPAPSDAALVEGTRVVVDVRAPRP
ncbi:MAG: efflux RND transporter periplasmic adaptor subunit [Deltaproteobacteria bacterium]|nr:efflux RND transporter periplasmic adaptor subunit [Deltaproteobacteria bacterium]